MGEHSERVGERRGRMWGMEKEKVTAGHDDDGKCCEEERRE